MKFFYRKKHKKQSINTKNYTKSRLKLAYFEALVIKATNGELLTISFKEEITECDSKFESCWNSKLKFNKVVCWKIALDVSLKSVSKWMWAIGFEKIAVWKFCYDLKTFDGLLAEILETMALFILEYKLAGPHSGTFEKKILWCLRIKW